MSSINVSKEFGSYASLQKYNEPYPKGYVQLPIHYGQSVVPDFGGASYASLTKGLITPNNYLNLQNAYGKGAANCGLFHTY